MGKGELLISIYDSLLNEYGPQNWWPAETPFEVLVGAILTQNTNWSNVEKAILSLKEKDLLDMKSIIQVDEEELGRAIRSSGFFRQKAKRLKQICLAISEEFSSMENMIKADKSRLRKFLLTVNGIGPETADSIILYAANMPSFVIDAYTIRIFSRLGIDPLKNYEEWKSFFEKSLPKDAQLFNEYHALIVQHAKKHCKRSPVCTGCPLFKQCKYPKIHKNTTKI